MAQGRKVVKMEDLPTSAYRLRELRLKRRLTQKQVADMLGVSLKMYNTYEMTDLMPSKNDGMEKLCRIFDVTPEYFYIAPQTKVDPNLFSQSKDPSEKNIKKITQSVMLQINALFAGTDLSNDEKEEMMAAISEMYFRAMKKKREQKKKNE